MCMLAKASPRALNACIMGEKARFVCSRCRPNAILWPVVCREKDGEEHHDIDNDKTTLSFTVFTSRDLKVDEEIILG